MLIIYCDFYFIRAHSTFIVYTIMVPLSATSTVSISAHTIFSFALNAYGIEALCGHVFACCVTHSMWVFSFGAVLCGGCVCTLWICCYEVLSWLLCAVCYVFDFFFCVHSMVCSVLAVWGLFMPSSSGGLHAMGGSLPSMRGGSIFWGESEERLCTIIMTVCIDDVRFWYH